MVNDAGASAIHHTNQREEKEETAGQASKPQNFNSTLVLLRRRLIKGIQSRAHLYYVIDRKALNNIKAHR